MTVAQEEARKLLRYLVCSLVSKPEEVRISERADPDGRTTFSVEVSEQDYGKVIGRGGVTIRALRRVVGAAARARAERREPARIGVEVSPGP